MSARHAGPGKFRVMGGLHLDAVERRALRIGITGTSPVMTSEEVMTARWCLSHQGCITALR
ncbi:hypothetical protein J4G37_19450 [Microvirga sp. 3-52]|nr:hypothetical protein [Microvirga sp. 3-52]